MKPMFSALGSLCSNHCSTFRNIPQQKPGPVQTTILDILKIPPLIRKLPVENTQRLRGSHRTEERDLKSRHWRPSTSTAHDIDAQALRRLTTPLPTKMSSRILTHLRATEVKIRRAVADQSTGRLRFWIFREGKKFSVYDAHDRAISTSGRDRQQTTE
jgi:hypothetical protein